MYLWETLTVKLCCLKGLAILVSKHWFFCPGLELSGGYGDLAYVMLCNTLVLWGVECHRSWRFVGRHFQLYDTSPMIPNWPWAWPCWNCTTSYKFSVSVKKMGEGWTGGASDIVKAEGSGEDPRATEGLGSNLPHPRVNKTKQHTSEVCSTILHEAVWNYVSWRPFLNYNEFHQIDPIDPASSRSNQNFWWGGRGRDSLTKRKIFQQAGFMEISFEEICVARAGSSTLEHVERPKLSWTETCC